MQGLHWIEGLQSENILGSSSQYAGISPRAKIDKGQTLNFIDSKAVKDAGSRVKVEQTHFTASDLNVFTGPEFERFPQLARFLESTSFTVAENNRMGYQLQEHTELKHTRSIMTAPVIPGTVQLTPSGRLIVLMRDAQVTGGYPRVLQLSEESINRLSQKVLGEEIRLRLN